MGVNAKTGGKRSWLIILLLGGFLLVQNFNKGDLFNTEDKGQEFVYSLLTDEELVYTKHATCRMDCRTISKKEVEKIMTTGTVNWSKSDKNDTPCPSYSLEGKTNDGQTVRIVFADCNNATKVVTAIDLDNDYDCTCE